MRDDSFELNEFREQELMALAEDNKVTLARHYQQCHFSYFLYWE